LFALLLVASGSLAIGCEQKPQPAPAPAPPPEPPKPPEPKPLNGCTSRFAIAEVNGNTCLTPPKIPDGWQILPQLAAQPPGNNKPVPVETPWTVFASRDGDDARKTGKSGNANDPNAPVAFCVYQWTGTDLPKQENFDALHATPECAIATPMAVEPSKATDAALGRAFERQARSIELSAKIPWEAAKVVAERAPRIAVVDATPFGLVRTDTSGHGFGVSRVIGSLACDDPDSQECQGRVRPYLALPYVVVTPEKWVLNRDGGNIGYFHDLFRAFRTALDEHLPDRNLIINLSLGWDPIKSDVNARETRIMHQLLERAYCEGVLVIAAAGNLTGSEGPLLPALMETTPPPNLDRCAELGVKMPPKAKDTFRSKLRLKPYQPLLHAVAAVDINDQRLMIVRPWGHSRLAAYGMAVTAPARTPTGFTIPMTGTSMSAAIVSGIAGAIWRARPNLSAADVMAIVYEGGRLLDYKSGNLRSRTEFCFDKDHDRCDKWQVRRASLCGALNVAMPAFKLTCVDFAKAPPADDCPPDPPSPPPPPPISPGPCRVANCGFAAGPMSDQLPVGVMPQPGSANCPSCTLSKTLGAVFGTATGTPDQPYNTVVRTWDQFWTPQDWPVFQTNHPVAGVPFFQSMQPPPTTQAAVMNWYYSSGGFNATQTTSLIVR
jgi:subtilisin family serine protease